MPMMIVTAKELRYAGRSMKEGDEFDAPLKDGQLWEKIGKAKFKPPAVAKPVAGNPPKPPPQPEKAKVEPAAAPLFETTTTPGDAPAGENKPVAPMTTEAAGDIVPGRRRYRTRDMTPDT